MFSINKVHPHSLPQILVCIIIETNLYNIIYRSSWENISVRCYYIKYVQYTSYSLRVRRALWNVNAIHVRNYIQQCCLNWICSRITKNREQLIVNKYTTYNILVWSYYILLNYRILLCISLDLRADRAKILSNETTQ